MNLKGLIRKAKETPAPGAAPENSEKSGKFSKPSGDAVASALRGWQDLQIADEQVHAVATRRTEGSSKSCGPGPGADRKLEHSVWLVEDFLPAELASQISALLRETHHDDFVQLRGKRTAKFGGDPGPPFKQEALPAWLKELCEVVGRAIGELPLSQSEAPSEDSGPNCLPNHVLVNQYRPGEGIMPHTDGPAYNPWAAIISLDAATVFDFWRDHAHSASGSPPALSLLVPPRSLLIFSGEAYAKHLHGIADRRSDDVDGDVRNWRTFGERWRQLGQDSVPDWAQKQLQVSWQNLMEKASSASRTSAEEVEASEAKAPEATDAEAQTARVSAPEGHPPTACLRRADRISLTLRRVPPVGGGALGC